MCGEGKIEEQKKERTKLFQSFISASQQRESINVSSRRARLYGAVYQDGHMEC